MNAITISIVFTGRAKGWSHIHVESKQNISARLVLLHVLEISHDPVLEFGRVNTSSQDYSKLFQPAVLQTYYVFQLENWCHKGIHAGIIDVGHQFTESYVMINLILVIKVIFGSLTLL